MARAAAIDDLFGHVPQAGELPMPAPDAAIYDTSIIGGLMAPPPGGHTPDSVRLQAMMVLNEARAATSMPWDARMIRRYTAGFPYWAEWLKNGEGDRLLAEFKAEMDRLGAPADEVAPNWRKMWGIA